MAYGAAIYARTTSDAGSHTSLLAAKSRLAPRKTVCIPRLELCSMVLGCKLLKCALKSIKTLQLTVDVSAWGDSTIALAWIRSTFVANHIANVEQMLPADKWKHVLTHRNSADHTTRPVAAAEWKNLQLVRVLLVADNWSLYSIATKNSRSKWRKEQAQTFIRRNHPAHSGSWRGRNHASSKSNQDLTSDRQKERRVLRFWTMGTFW